MIFIGDVHGEFHEYSLMLQNFGDTPSIQLGDMGIGFGLEYEVPPPQHRFIRGNHDKPYDCVKMPTYLGDFGYLADENIFFISGAFSVDYMHRTLGVDWWEDEELSHYQMNKVFDLYSRAKPKIVCTHDCPIQLLQLMYSGRRIIKTKTGALFDELFDVYQPQAWVFAHHHKSHHFSVKGTEFFALRILEALKLTEQTVFADYLGDNPEGEIYEGKNVNLYGGSSESGQVY